MSEPDVSDQLVTIYVTVVVF